MTDDLSASKALADDIAAGGLWELRAAARKLLDEQVPGG